ncbi:MAG: OmpP1/FadL family transporter [Bacteroidales bacterium]
MKKIFLSIGLLLGLALFSTAYAQYDVDALRFSYLGFGGTARNISAGGAFGAAGADFSTLSTNPAGIGLYKNSEINLSPSFLFNKVESSYYGSSNNDINYSFNMPGAGLILTLENKNSNWKNVQFGFGFNKLQDFNKNTDIEGFNDQSSLMTEYLDKVQNNNGELSFYDTELAWNTNLLYYDSLNSTYRVDAPHGGINQRKTIEESGAINEMTFSFGGNYNDKLYTGVTIGIPILNYTHISRHAETDTQDSIPMFSSFSLDEKIETTGSGINFKFGLLYRPANWIRLGGAIHTPTFYSLHENYSRNMISHFENADFNSDESVQGEFNYELTTPMKALGNIAFIIGKKGLITAEYQYTDYSTARLSNENDISTSSTYDFKEDNDAVDAKYTSAHNIKVGGEFNIQPFQLRAGYALFGSPYTNDINDGERSYYTFGFGIREKHYYADLAYVMEQYDEDYYLYSPQYVKAAKNSYNSNRFVLTFGIKL